jgi:hypothetical protein
VPPERAARWPLYVGHLAGRLTRTRMKTHALQTTFTLITATDTEAAMLTVSFKPDPHG